MKRVALIVAGGTGTRFGSNIPKQFVPIKGKPILFYSIRAFEEFCDKIIVVLHDDLVEDWKQLCNQNSFSVNHEIVSGGASRSHSVRNGLEKVEADSIVAVHDAARPLIHSSQIEKLFNEAEKHGNAVPVLNLTDSLRKLDENGNRSVDRKKFRLVQTPQCFQSETLKKAYQSTKSNDSYSDDAGLAEAYGIDIHLIEGQKSNIKITYPQDIEIAEILLSVCV